MIKDKLVKYGFTFIEMVVAVAIMAILAVLVIPSINERLNRTKVDTAAQTMLKNGQFLHKWANITGGYSKSRNDQGKCPYLPFQYESDSSNRHFYYLASTDSNLQGQVGTSKGVILKPSSCFANSFTLRAYPICGSVVEKSGVICLDHDGNLIKNADQDCNPRGSTSQIICVYDNTKDGNRDNDSSESNQPAPPAPVPSIDPVSYCDESAHTGDLFCKCEHKESEFYEGACKDPVYCLEHPAQEQCKCVLHPDAKGCLKYCDTMDGHNDKSCPGWCAFDPSRESDPYCDKESGGDTPSSCIQKPEREICYDQCKFQSPKADWCNKACPKINPTPGWCESDPNINPYHEGDLENDTCGNTFICRNPAACRNYSPDDVTNRSKGWDLQSCNTPGANNFFESGRSTPYSYGAKINTNSCVTYKCNSQNGCSTDQPSGAPSDRTTSQWIPCYSMCPATLKSGSPLYNEGNYSFDSQCGALFICQDKTGACSDITGHHQPGAEKSADGSTVWRQATESDK